MARPKEFDVDEALDRALDAFWQKGFEATSLDDLTKTMGVQKASLYGTFGDKRELFLRALRRYQDSALLRIRKVLASERSCKRAIHALFLGIVDDATAKRGRRGCFCVNTSVELGPHDRAVAEQMRKYSALAEAVLVATLERGKGRGELQKRLDSAKVASFLMSQMLGLQVMAKSAPGRKKLAEIVAVALSVLDR